MSLDVLSPRTFCLMDIMSPDVFPTGVSDFLSVRMLCPSGRFVPGCFVSGRFVWGTDFFALNTTYFKKKNFTSQRATFEIKYAFQKIFLESFANPKLYQCMAIFENFVKITVPYYVCW
jgi:hypothetical protein